MGFSFGETHAWVLVFVGRILWQNVVYLEKNAQKSQRHPLCLPSPAVVKIRGD